MLIKVFLGYYQQSRASCNHIRKDVYFTLIILVFSKLFIQYCFIHAATAPIIIHNSTNDQVQKFFWNQKFEKCPLVQYIVNGSASCGECVQSGNRYTCTDHSIGVNCTVKIMVRLCESVVNERMLTINISSLSTTETSPTTSKTQDGMLQNGKYLPLMQLCIIGHACTCLSMLMFTFTQTLA